MNALRSFSGFGPLVRRSAAIAALCLGMASSQAAVDVFVKLYRQDGTTIPGDSTDSSLRGDKGWFAISSYSFGVRNQVFIGDFGDGGAGAGRATFTPAGLAKQVNIVSPAIYRAAAEGQVLRGMKIVVRKAGAMTTPEPYLEYEFQTVMVSAQNWGFNSGDDLPNETVTFEFGLMRLSFRPQDAQGRLGTAVTQAWNIIENSPQFEPLPATPN